MSSGEMEEVLTCDFERACPDCGAVNVQRELLMTIPGLMLSNPLMEMVECIACGRVF